jgi:BT1 family
MIGEAVLEPLLDMLNWIPTSALIALAVPHGMEASAFAFMAGLSNFARMVSELLGAYLFKAAGVITSGGASCDFSALPGLVLGCHVLAPTIICVPAAWIIPHMPQTGLLAPDQGDKPSSDLSDLSDVELVPGELATVDQEESFETQ